MPYRLDYKYYQRRFHIPLRTAHGDWDIREGLLIRLEDAEGKTGYGEVAPVPGFTTESMEDAKAWLGQNQKIDTVTIGRIPSRLPCVRVALEWARMQIQGIMPSPEGGTVRVAALLPAGPSAVATIEKAQLAGHTAFKWKMGVMLAWEEMAILKDLIDRLKPGDQLRLDANGGLNHQEARLWMDHLSGCPIEYIEQPMGVRHLKTLWDLADYFPTPIALDESVSSFDDLRRAVDLEWPGYLVVKPVLLHRLEAFLAWRETVAARLVYSSAFETGIGYELCLHLATSDRRSNHAAGFGTTVLFEEDGLNHYQAVGQLSWTPLDPSSKDRLWNRL
jgi:O-succinylbenzoate synthase